MAAISSYMGNTNLKQVGEQIHFTQEQIEEYRKCAENPVYFIRNYVHIVHVDRGIIKFDLYDCQENLIDHMHTNRRSILLAPRQVGKSQTSNAYILWFILFNDHKNCVILANKAKTANIQLARLKEAYQLLPKWLQHGIVEWNKTSIELENGSKVSASATSASGPRGDAIALLYLDEFAFVPKNIADEFWTSVYPTISSGKETKVMISSTPNGYNLFWKMWTEAEAGTNDFKHFRMNWWEVPGRDEAWLAEQERALGSLKFAQEVLVQFQGSTNTLFNSSSLATLAKVNPIKETNDLKVYETPVADHSYVSIVDVARGTGNDYSVNIIIDVTLAPYKVVAVYRNNEVSPYTFPQVIFQLASTYNEAYCLIENNDAGGQVADMLYSEYEYTNMFFSKANELSYSGGKSMQSGLRTTSKVKTLGCAAIKTIVEHGNLVVNDYNIISEMGTFIAHRGSYAAEAGYNDDLIMCLVLFGWLTQQTIFKNLTDVDTRAVLFSEQLQELNNNMVPFGFISNGLEPDYIEESVQATDENAWMFDPRLQVNYEEEEA